MYPRDLVQKDNVTSQYTVYTKY